MSQNVEGLSVGVSQSLSAAGKRADDIESAANGAIAGLAGRLGTAEGEIDGLQDDVADVSNQARTVCNMLHVLMMSKVSTFISRTVLRLRLALVQRTAELTQTSRRSISTRDALLTLRTTLLTCRLLSRTWTFPALPSSTPSLYVTLADCCWFRLTLVSRRQ